MNSRAHARSASSWADPCMPFCTLRTCSFVCREGSRCTPNSFVSAYREDRGCIPCSCSSDCCEGRGCTPRRSFSSCREDRGCTPRSYLSSCRAGRGCTQRSWSSACRGDMDCAQLLFSLPCEHRFLTIAPGQSSRAARHDVCSSTRRVSRSYDVTFPFCESVFLLLQRKPTSIVAFFTVFARGASLDGVRVERQRCAVVRLRA